MNKKGIFFINRYSVLMVIFQIATLICIISAFFLKKIYLLIFLVGLLPSTVRFKKLARLVPLQKFLLLKNFDAKIKKEKIVNIYLKTKIQDIPIIITLNPKNCYSLALNTSPTLLFSVTNPHISLKSPKYLISGGQSILNKLTLKLYKLRNISFDDKLSEKIKTEYQQDMKNITSLEAIYKPNETTIVAVLNATGFLDGREEDLIKSVNLLYKISTCNKQ